MKRGLFTLAGLAVIGTIALGLLYLDYRGFLQSALHRNPEPAILMLPAGTSFTGMIQRLEQAGLTDQPLYWRFLGWQYDADARIKAGEYRIPSGMGPAWLLQRIIRGQVIQHSFTIVEGWRFAELMHALPAQPALAHTLGGASAKEIMAGLGHPEEYPEGWFLPETYHFPRGTTDLALLQRAHRAMHGALRRVWAQRDSPLPLQNAYEALILASIVEKETAVPEERKRIAGVFVRRLQRGMKLQTDPTVIYGLGAAFDGNLRLADLRTDTPYNTYTRAGLPPTPICLPGLASLKAVLHPAPGEALYFVATGDGGHVFSATLEQHQRAVRRYQLER